MITLVAEQRAILGTIRQESEDDTDRYGQKNVVPVMIPVDDDGASYDCGGNQGCYNKDCFPEVSLGVCKRFQLRIQVQG